VEAVTTRETVERLWAVLEVGNQMANLLRYMVEVLGEDDEIVIEVIRPLLSEWEATSGIMD
jgi:hypothetical protein